ncbi:Ser/Thr protein phosphatase family protein [Taphrina deformans PYCC 5710]|uniref:Ser/Thr protein phosphatase family protein n=1 Tax=Taphrina deformans (strain PYCC 5710 / ATCC 11124 / CBS 356.35 / IMI 108563 / JCM 9778 / NBRC 8474) TaxID=1097556 RepID=R4XDJ5_TAPDE|nr:Ser/Thr protein phosphatase family protein [Taphrina deformans PYCC 5710]|eukprot:CCG83666.1 Ser/Thr protein phosphatase family protein [Taphrina deformans PYCC 5710]
MHADTLHFLTSPVETRHSTRAPRAHDKPDPPDPAHDRVKFVVVSDTHSHPDWTTRVPDGDVFVHCGDLTRGGTPDQLRSVYEEIAALPHRIKVVIAGNHDLGLDPSFIERHADQLRDLKTGMTATSYRQLRRMWKSREATGRGILFLEHEFVSITVRHRHFRIFGSAWTPEFCDWAFMYPVDRDIWSPTTRPSNNGTPAAPVYDERTAKDDEDFLLVTHGPAKGILDQVVGIGSVGCPFLAEYITRIKPVAHFFGHIHEGAEIGLHQIQHKGTEQTTLSVNAALLDEKYRLAYPATVVFL